MSIESKVITLTKIDSKIKQLSKEISMLKKEAKNIKGEITKYLETKDERGFAYGGSRFEINKEIKPVSKPKKDKAKSYVEVIEQYGIENPKQFLEELMKAGKNEKEITKLKIS